MLAFNGPKVANPTADVSSDLLCDVVSDVQPAVEYRFLRRSHGILNEGAHLARLLLLDVFQGIEVFDFAGESDRKLFCVELFNMVRTTATIHQRSPRFFYRIANGSY
jgi:hypothetical protein